MPNTLTLRVIGDRDEGILDEFAFYSGEVRTLRLQLFDGDNDQKICIPATATKTLILSGTPDNLEVNDADITLDTEDSSIFSASISAAMSVLMISGKIEFQYSMVGGTIRIATIEYGLKRLTLISE